MRDIRDRSAKKPPLNKQVRSCRKISKTLVNQIDLDEPIESEKPKFQKNLFQFSPYLDQKASGQNDVSDIREGSQK